MAKFTDEEREAKVLEIANYIIETNSSTRKTAARFNISNATVSDWMNNVLKNLNYKKFLMVQQVLIQNKPKTIEDDIVRDRVIKAATLIKRNFTVEEIAKHYKVSVNVINEDLQTRLPRISKELYEEVRSVLKKHSMSNLKNIVVDEGKGNNDGNITK